MKKLYSNIGDKVCKVAELCGRIGIVVALIGIVMLIGAFASADDLIIASIIVIVLGVVCVISSWPLYAFGQITNDVREIKKNINSQTFDADLSALPEI